MPSADSSAANNEEAKEEAKEEVKEEVKEEAKEEAKEEPKEELRRGTGATKVASGSETFQSKPQATSASSSSRAAKAGLAAAALTCMIPVIDAVKLDSATAGLGVMGVAMTAGLFTIQRTYAAVDAVIGAVENKTVEFVEALGD